VCLDGKVAYTFRTLHNFVATTPEHAQERVFKTSMFPLEKIDDTVYTVTTHQTREVVQVGHVAHVSTLTSQYYMYGVTLTYSSLFANSTLIYGYDDVTKEFPSPVDMVKFILVSMSTLLMFLVVLTIGVNIVRGHRSSRRLIFYNVSSLIVMLVLIMLRYMYGAVSGNNFQLSWSYDGSHHNVTRVSAHICVNHHTCAVNITSSYVMPIFVVVVLYFSYVLLKHSSDSTSLRNDDDGGGEYSQVSIIEDNGQNE
jgi:hypothetical protein